MNEQRELKQRAEELIELERVSPCDSKRVMLIGPETVLALFADLEQARNGMKHSCAIRLKKQIEQLETQRDQLKAENEELRKNIDDMSPFKGAPLNGPDLKCLACGGYHYGIQGLPCPNMRITASAAMGKGEGHEQ